VLSLANLFKMNFSDLRVNEVLLDVNYWDSGSDNSGGEDDGNEGIYAYISADLGVSICWH